MYLTPSLLPECVITSLVISNTEEKNSITSPWRWRQHGPPKRWYPNRTVHGVTRGLQSSPWKLQVRGSIQA